MAGPEQPIADTRAQDVRVVGGAAALAITVLTATSANVVTQAFASAAKSKLELDADGLQVIINAFLITAPLAIAVTIAALGLTRIEFTGDQSAYKALVFLAVAVGVGLVLGNFIYQQVYAFEIQVNYADLDSTLSRTSGPWFAKLGAALIWVLVGYFELFGPQHFAAAVIAGGTAAYAIHRYLPASAVTQV